MKAPGEQGFVLVFYLALLAASVADVGFKVVCDMKRNGNSGTLTCHFSVDLGQLKHDFSVQRYELEDDATPDTVLVCIYRADREDPECNVEHGYTFDNKTISNVITLEIPQLQEVHEGWYICQVIPPNKKENDTKPCKIEHNETQLSVEGDSKHETLLIVLLLVTFAILIGIITYALMKLRRKIFGRCIPSCRSDNRDASASEPMNSP